MYVCLLEVGADKFVRAFYKKSPTNKRTDSAALASLLCCVLREEARRLLKSGSLFAVVNNGRKILTPMKGYLMETEREREDEEEGNALWASLW